MRMLGALALLLCVARAEDAVPSPKAAWTDLQAAAIDVGLRERWNFESKQRKEYLARWEKSGNMAEGEQAYFLGLFLEGEGRTAEAAVAFRTAMAVPEVAQEARIRFVSAVLLAESRGTMDRAALTEAQAAGDAALAQSRDPKIQARLLIDLGRCRERLGDPIGAVKSWIAAAGVNPEQAFRVARLGGGAILRHAEDAGAARQQVEDLVQAILKIHNRVDAGENRFAETRARRTADKIARIAVAARLLGEPMPAWEALHSFGRAKGIGEYRGRVVLVHFGSTWSVSAVHALPALRDLFKEYKDRCTFVGLWLDGFSVYESRFELDEDFEEQAKGRTTPAALRVRPAPGQELSKAEIEVHSRFFENHRLGWNHVRVPLVECGKRFGMVQQPFILLVDRSGRVRYVRPGQLARADKRSMADLRRRIDALIAAK